MTKPTDDISSAFYMALNNLPSSSEAKALTSYLVKQVAQVDKVGIGKKFVDAMGALLADLLLTARSDPSRYSYRSMASGSFTDAPIGYQVFRRAVLGLHRLTVLDLVAGTGGGSVVGQATRFRASTRLLQLAESYEVKPAEWASHFRARPRPKAIAKPIVCKSSSRMKLGKKIPGEPMRIDPADATATALGKQVNELNASFAAIAIEPAEKHYAFQRVFNQGDTMDFDWNKGGRLVSIGDSYQQLKPWQREEMKLNGERVTEIDIRASHLTILHALLKLPFDPDNAYDAPGIPREVAKAWVTMTLGYDKFQTRWSTENKRKLPKEYGIDLSKQHPIRQVREAVLKRIPALSDWPNCPYRWGDLQYLESCAIIDAVWELAIKHGIPALPVHDSIIVPTSKQALGRRVLESNFERHVGVCPRIAIK